MIKELSHCNRVDAVPAPSKRKRDDGAIDEIFSSSRQVALSADDFVYPFRKRPSTLSFCTSSYDSERRDGPADDDCSSSSDDDETAALVANFRSSVFRQGDAASVVAAYTVSPQSASSYRAQSPFNYVKQDEDDDDDADACYPDFPSIGRATTICDDTSDSSIEGSIDPPEMEDNSRPTSPRECEEELLDQQDYHDRDLHSSSASLEYQQLDRSGTHSQEKDAIEAARERPEWTLGPSRPSPLWTTTSDSKSTRSLWPASWTGVSFHQGSA